MKLNYDNNKESNIYKGNSNLIAFLKEKKEIKQLVRVERDDQIISYGKKSYISKLINCFRADNCSGTKSYWLEVSE